MDTIQANKVLNFQVQLIPKISKDEKSGFYYAEFEDFPQLSAFDETEKGAVLRLIGLFELMVKEHEREVVETLVIREIERIRVRAKEFKVGKVLTVEEVKEGNKTMELQMVG